MTADEVFVHEGQHFLDFARGILKKNNRKDKGLLLNNLSEKRAIDRTNKYRKLRDRKNAKERTNHGGTNPRTNARRRGIGQGGRNRPSN